jgi:hypothetical protein
MALPCRALKRASFKEGFVKDTNTAVQEALDLIETVRVENEDRIKKAEGNLTAIVSDAFLGKEIVLASVADDEERQKTPKAYKVVQVEGLYLVYKNRNDRPVSIHFSKVKLA